MKKILVMAIFVSAIAMVSCGGSTKKDAAADSTKAQAVLVTDSVAVTDSAGDTTVTEEITATPVN